MLTEVGPQFAADEILPSSWVRYGTSSRATAANGENACAIGTSRSAGPRENVTVCQSIQATRPSALAGSLTRTATRPFRSAPASSSVAKRGTDASGSASAPSDDQSLESWM